MSVLWRIEMFGGLRARSAQTTLLRFQTQKTGALLACLALPVGQALGREPLAERLWPGAEPKAGRESLRTALASLRRQLEPPGTPAGSVLVATRSTVNLRSETVETDVAEFEALLDLAKRVTTPQARRGHLAAAVALYRGELLAGYYEEWMLPEQRRLAGLLLDALRLLIPLHAEAGDLEAAREAAARAVQEDPFHEETARALIRLSLATGQVAAARRHYDDLERLLREELGKQPAAATRALEAELPPREAVVSAVLSPPAMASAVTPPVPHDVPPVAPPRLPLRFTRFFGRESEIAWLTERLTPAATPCLITLTGTGGTGKTRLALEVAYMLQEAFHGAVWFVPLADIADASSLPDAMLKALNLPRTPQSPLEVVMAHLAVQPSLLVLDNFEHMGEAGAAQVSALRSRLPDLALLITSRQALGLSGEREYPVTPLATPNAPGTPERLLEFASVELLVDRAQSVRPDFQITRRNAAALAAVCLGLEGLPLALELAAPLLQVLTPAQMLTQLSRRFDLLVSRRKDVLVRHSSLRNMIAWSYDRLDPDLQTFFARCSVFQGGWTLDAAEHVCDTPNALEMLRKLREHSLIVVEEQGEEMRYRLLETLREFGKELLSAIEFGSILDRHADYYRRLAAEAAPHLIGPRQTVWLDVLEAEYGNLQLALEHTHMQGTWRSYLEFCLHLHGFWLTRNHYEEAEKRLLIALEHYLEADALRAEGLRRAAVFATLTPLERQRAFLRESLAIWKRLDNKKGVCDVLITFVDLSPAGGDDTPPEVYMEELKRWIPQDDLRIRALVLHKLGVGSFMKGHLSEATEYLTEALALRRNIGERRSIALSLLNLGMLQYETEGWQAGKNTLDEALTLFLELGDRFGQAVVQRGLAQAAYGLGAADEAYRLLHCALATQIELDTDIYICQARSDLADLCRRMGKRQEACDLAYRNLKTLRDMGFGREVAATLEGLAAMVDDSIQAARWLGASQALRDATDCRHYLYQRLDYADRVRVVRTALGEAAFEKHWNAGYTLSQTDVIDEALAAMNAIVGCSPSTALNH